MVTIQAGRLVPIPFDEMMDPQTGKIRVRMVDLDSETYKIFYEYMIRLRPEDLNDPVMVKKLAEAGNLTETELKRRFAPLFKGH